MHPALADALARRGRTWGADNVATLKVALRELKPHSHPARLRLLRDRDRRTRLMSFGAYRCDHASVPALFVTRIAPAP